MDQKLGTKPTSKTLKDFGLWHLRHVDLLKSVDREALNKFMRLFQLREFKRGETIYVISGRRDEHLQRMYFVIKGRVKISSVDDASGKELLLLLIKPGEPFGLLNSVGNETTELHATALQASLVGYVARDDFDKLIKHAGACSRLVKLIGERSVEVVARFEDLAFRSVPVRLARVLVHLAQEFPEQRKCGIGIDVPLTRQEIANLIGARREVVSTHLSRFKREGIVAFHKGRICIHDHDALAKLTE
ncbi:MAG: Crp/Fnr family transcriptional regulator [Acidobacteria bacterium]|jgi:CRP/FNR family transcriptional regulator, cyclic AMP receptor protein|nr:MAG: Crp/Fnr family transcriptional regulator [Acidobacteriota bacterium]